MRSPEPVNARRRPRSSRPSPRRRPSRRLSTTTRAFWPPKAGGRSPRMGRAHPSQEGDDARLHPPAGTPLVSKGRRAAQAAPRTSYTGGLRPPDPLTPSLAGAPAPRRSGGARPRAMANGGLRPRTPLRRRSRGPLAPRRSGGARPWRACTYRGLRPPDPLTPSLAGAPAPRRSGGARPWRA